MSKIPERKFTGQPNNRLQEIMAEMVQAELVKTNPIMSRLYRGKYRKPSKFRKYKALTFRYLRNLWRALKGFDFEEYYGDW